jgi:hypothetical protein
VVSILAIHLSLVEEGPNANPINSSHIEFSTGHPVLVIRPTVFLIKLVLSNFRPQSVGVTGFHVAGRKVFLEKGAEEHHHEILVHH